MKIGLQTWGTDGDFMPFLALALGLKNAGHDVTLAYTSVDGKDYSNREGVDCVNLLRANGNVKIPNLNPYAISSKPGSFGEYTKLLNAFYEPFTEAMQQASEELCKDNDLVIGHAACYTLATSSQKQQVPRVSLVLVPLVVQTSSVSPIGKDFGSLINNLMWSVGDKISTSRWYKKSKSIRKTEGLPKVKSLQKEVFTSEVGTIVASSPSLFVRPKDWNDSIYVTGFLNVPENKSSEIPEDLIKFLKEGEQPIYMTFGSCLQFDEEASTELLLETAKNLPEHRFIIQLNDSIEAGKLNDNLFITDQVPHSKVFPVCKLIVHHGGAGSTQAAVLAGKPAVVVAHGFDQPYWANAIHIAGISGKPLTRHGLNSRELAKATSEVLDSPDLFEKAAAIGKQLKSEDGVDRAVEIINQILEK